MWESSVVQRFLRYVRIDTRSEAPKPGAKQTSPSSEGQLEFATLLMSELDDMGYQSQQFSDGSFIVHLPASEGLEGAPHVVYAAHMDTYFGFPGAANPQRHHYQGGDLEIGNGVVIPSSDLSGLVDKYIVTSDGTTLLGADDKAGVAALMETLQRIQNYNVPHGELTFWFCTDEEIGELDINVLPAEMVQSWDILWTVDGERLETIDVGSLICAQMEIVFTGEDAHPGVGGHNLKPAHYAAAVFVAKLATKAATPMETSGLEPFYYCTKIRGNASRAVVDCKPRSFNTEESAGMVRVATKLAHQAADQFGVQVEVTSEIACINTRPPIETGMDLVQVGIATLAAQLGVKPEEVGLVDIRGGTTGGMIALTYPNLPCPNLGTGGVNLHGPKEFLVASELATLPSVLIGMIANYTNTARG